MHISHVQRVHPLDLPSILCNLQPVNPPILMSFWCPQGGEFYACPYANSRFVGCCSSKDPCVLGCQPGANRPMAFDYELKDRVPNASCAADHNFYICDSGDTYVGCCQINPCTFAPGCPDGLTSAAFVDSEEQAVFFNDTNVANFDRIPVTTAAVALATLLPNQTAQPLDISSFSHSQAIASTIVPVSLFSATCIGLTLWICYRRWLSRHGSLLSSVEK